MAKLTVINGKETERQYLLTASDTIIGRQPDCDIVLNADTVSRRHARLFCIGKHYYIEDLGSHNGTYINNRRLAKPLRIDPNDTIKIGNINFRFEVTSDTHPNPATPSTSISVQPQAVEIDAAPDQTSTVIVSSFTLNQKSSQQFSEICADEKLTSMLQVLENLTNSVDLDQVLPCLLDTLFKIFPKTDRGFIVIKEPDGKLTPKWHKLRHQTEQNPQVLISRKIIEHALQQKAALLSEDAGQDQRFDASKSILNYQIHSVICAPLLDSDGNSFGVIQLDSLNRNQRFQTSDLHLLAGMAAPAALAINYARLYEQALIQQRIQHDLEVAHQIQNSFLPAHPPELSDYEFYHYYQPANKIGGDFFDYITLPDQTLVIIVADVVGHGIAAALLMAKLSVHIAYSLKAHQDPEAIMFHLNQSFCQDNPDDHFVTLVMVILQPDQHQVTVMNAGHMAPFLKRQSGEVVCIGKETTGLPLGVLNDTEYQPTRSTLTPGELILLYTDGINETQNAQGLFYGEQKIADILQSQDGHAIQTGKQLIADLSDYCEGQPNNDDICLVSFSRNL